MVKNACDLFSYKEEDKTYVMLSFFKKKSGKPQRHIQFDKKIFIFENKNVNQIAETITHYLTSNNIEVTLYKLGNSLSEEIVLATKYISQKQNLSEIVNKKGVYSLLTALKHPNKKDYEYKNHTLHISISNHMISSKEYAYTLSAFNSLACQYKNDNVIFKDKQLILADRHQFLSVLTTNINTFISDNDLATQYNKIQFNFQYTYEGFEKDFKCFFKSKSKIKDMSFVNRAFKDFEITKQNKQEFQKKILDIKSKLIDVEANHVLYTDGSVLDFKNKRYVSGAYIIHTEFGYKYGSKVLDFQHNEKYNSLESEYLAFYLGLKELVDLGLIDKKLTFVLDCDSVVNFLNETKNNNQEECILDSILLYKIKKLLKIINHNYNAISIKSHKQNSNNIISKHNRSVDRLAFNSILKHLETNNIKHDLKKRA